MSESLNGYFRGHHLMLYSALVILNIGLVWLLPYFPTQDGPSHLYNLVILHDLVNGGKEWGDYFSYQIHAVPNLGFHLFTYPLLTLFSPLVAERLFITLYILLMTSTVPCFLYSFGSRPFPLSFFVFPILFNYTLMMGFYSFSIAVPCMLLSMAVAWTLRRRSVLMRFIAFNSAGLVLFYLHLIPFMIYLGFLYLLIPFTVTGVRRCAREFALLLGVTSPCLATCAAYFVRNAESFQQITTQDTSAFHYLQLFTELFLFSVDTFSFWQVLPWAALFVPVFFFTKARWKDVIERKCIREEHGAILLLACILLGSYLVFPSGFGGGGYFNQRLPWVLFLIVLPVLKIPEDGVFRRFGGVILPGIALFFLLVNAAIFYQQSSCIQEFLSGLTYPIPRKAIIVTYKPRVYEWPRVDSLLHAASYYGMEKGSIDAGNYELLTGLFPVKFKHRPPLLPNEKMISYFPGRINWRHYPSIGFLLGWEVDGNGREKLKECFSPVFTQKRFSLWVRKAGPVLP
jgi:hypothetical protein